MSARRRNPSVPAPAVMPVDRASWFSQLNLSNFVNAYYEYRDLQACGTGRRLLIVGSGQGLDTVVLRWRGYEVTRLDIDETFEPEVVGSVHDMHMFQPGAFDAVIASHVLEHFAEAYLDDALREIARVGRYALSTCRSPAAMGCCDSWRGSTIWTCGSSGTPSITSAGPTGRRRLLRAAALLGARPAWVPRTDMRQRLSAHFEILSAYRNFDWLPSYNFVLRSRAAQGRGR